MNIVVLEGEKYNELINKIDSLEKTIREQVKVIPPEEYLTPDELSKLLKVSPVTLWNWDKKGIIRPLRIGNQKRYKRSEIEEGLVPINCAYNNK